VEIVTVQWIEYLVKNSYFSHCSMDRISCKEFLFSNFIVKSLRAQKSQSSKKHDNIFVFLSGIKNCSLKISTNDWLANDVCKKSKSSV